MSRSALRTEVWLVLGVSLGASALWSLVRLADLLTRPGGLAGATTSLNTPADPTRPWLSVASDLVSLVVALVPAVLALYLLGRDGMGGTSATPDPATQVSTVPTSATLASASPGPMSPAPASDEQPVRTGARGIGLDLRHPVRDLRDGALLAALVGLPGLALYLAATAAGLNSTVEPATATPPWWAVGLLVLAALKNGVLEEVVVVGYLTTRGRQLGWAPWAAVVVAALLRGVYHLYQGFAGGLGNVVMGLLFGAWFLRRGRVMPLVVAHVLIDLVAFLGYAWIAPRVGWL
ncbi:CPBP family intramembrane glutamic endopeptidase [Kytococcus sp. Marseille-QA3725]